MMEMLIKTDSSGTTVLIRLMVGTIFLSEGIQKFVYPAIRGAGRFDRIGFPSPESFANLVGSFEVLAGILLLLGFLTRFGALSTFVIITVAIVVTKLPIGLGESLGPFVLRELKIYGFWSMAHEMRTDLAMWLGSLYLLIEGGGRWSVDSRLQHR
jgi:uncharacterized membrane protein YphA (DoxX/SURF4 family)